MRHIGESAIYGVVLVAGLVVVVGEKTPTLWELMVKVAATVVVFWAAHAYASAVAHLGDYQDQQLPLSRRLLGAAQDAAAHSWGMLVAALIPLSVLVFGMLGVLSDEQAIWAALWVSVALLGVLGYLKIAVWTTDQWVRLLGGAITSALGLVLVLLKTYVH